MKRTTAAALLGVACLLAMPPIAQARYRDGMNLYQYVRSAPVTHLDPMGLETVVALDTEKGKEPVEVEGYLEVRVAGAVVKREPVKETITYKASFEREARRFNALVDEKIKEIQSSNDDRFTLNGTPVKKGKLIKGLKNARIVVMDIDSGNEAKAYAQIRAAFTKAGPCAIEWESFPVLCWSCAKDRLASPGP